MGFLDNLKQIFNLNADVKIAENLKSVKLIDASNSGQKTKNVYKNQINIQIDTLLVPVDCDDKGVTAQVKQALRQAVQQENALVIEADSKAEFDDYQRYAKTAGQNQVIQDLLAVVSPDDGNLLRAAFYLRKAYQEGNSVVALKKDIVERYGERGKNISNLCSAGYFETVIHPMLQELQSQGSFSNELFRERFDVIVSSYPFAVFISVQSKVAVVIKEVQQKIETNKKYGIRQLKIHAIGATNLKKAQAIIESKTITMLLNRPPVITLIQNVYEAEIYF